MFYSKQRNAAKPIFSQPKRLAGLIFLIVAILIMGGCTPANQLPIISSLMANQERVESADILQIECTASDPDGDELSYSWSTDSGHISGEGSTASWTAPDEPGDYILTVQVTDGRDGEATSQLIISVEAPNDPPTIESLIVTAEHIYLEETTAGFTTQDVVYKALNGREYKIECVASDPDGDKLTFEWLADGGEWHGEGAIATWHSPPEKGEVTLIVKVSDGRGDLAIESVVFVVTTCTCAFEPEED